MKYKLLTFFGLLVSFNIQADIYTLDNNSLFSNSNGNSQLTGSLSLDFIFGLPPLPGNNLIYTINSLNLSENNNSIILTNNIPASSPILLLGNNIELDYQNNISNIYDVILSLTETDLGENVKQYQEQVLSPVNINNISYNSVTVGNNLLPNNLLLTYEWHSLVFNVQPAIYPAGTLGNPLRYTMLSDTNNGTLIINAQPASVPLPASIWLFGTTLLGLLGLKRRKH